MTKLDGLVVLHNLASDANIFVRLHVGSFQPSVAVSSAFSYGLECLTQAPTNTAPTPPSMSIRVFKNTMSSHLVFPCFFSASSSARVHSSQGIIDASLPQPRPAKWLFPTVKALFFFLGLAARDILKDCCQPNILPDHISRPRCWAKILGRRKGLLSARHVQHGRPASEPVDCAYATSDEECLVWPCA